MDVKLFKVKFIQDAFVDKKPIYLKGDIVELNSASASRWVKRNIAVYFEETKVEEVVEEKKEETTEVIAEEVVEEKKEETTEVKEVANKTSKNQNKKGNSKK